MTDTTSDLSGVSEMTDVPRIAVIGGSGLNTLPDFVEVELRRVSTPYGSPSAALAFGHIGDVPLVFLPRHGAGHTVAPHAINYRANIAALAAVGVKQVIACCAVGGIGSDMGPRAVAIPDQIIDYTWGREHTFVGDTSELVSGVAHVDFTDPFSATLRTALIDAAAGAGIDVVPGGCYGATQGPRLETAAEIKRLARDGCDLVGMTGMPEAALAREAGLEYAMLAIVANWAAGLADADLTIEEIYANIEAATANVMLLLSATIKALPASSSGGQASPRDSD